MIRNLFLSTLFLLAALPVFAAGPEVQDLTREEAGKPAEGQIIIHGTIQAACAPWQGGLSVGLALDNHVGATLYLSIDSLPDKVNQPFKAGGDMREAGSAVIYRCDDKDANCNQLSGTVTIGSAKNPVYTGVIHIEGEEPMVFNLKRTPSSAKCDG